MRISREMNTDRSDAEEEDSVVAVDEDLLNQTDDEEFTENEDRNEDMHPVANMRKLLTPKLNWRAKY